MRRATIGFFEREQVAEDLARKFAELLGWEVQSDNPHFMRDSGNLCYKMAIMAVERMSKSP
jgi:hypothetical protein